MANANFAIGTVYTMQVRALATALMGGGAPLKNAKNATKVALPALPVVKRNVFHAEQASISKMVNASRKIPKLLYLSLLLLSPL